MSEESNESPDSAVIDMTLFKRLIDSQKPMNLLWGILVPGYWPLMMGTTIISLLQAQGKLTDDDAQNVVEIIRSGSESNVKRLKIKMDRENSLGVDVALGKLKAARPFRFTAGMRGETSYEIDVEYFEADKV